MEFKNLDKRFLLLLAKNWKERGIGGRYRTSNMYKGCSDLPGDDIAGEPDRLNTEGLITFAADRHRLYLADKGISRIQSSLISNDRWNSMGV